MLRSGAHSLRAEPQTAFCLGFAASEALTRGSKK